MEKFRIHQKNVAKSLKEIFSDVKDIASLCNSYIAGKKKLNKTCCETYSAITVFNGEVCQLAVVLQFEDIILQSFLSLDTLYNEIERINSEGITLSEDEYKNFLNLINDVAENTVARIVSSLENIDLRLSKLSSIIKKYDSDLFGRFSIESVREKINLCACGFSASEIVPDISPIRTFSEIKSPKNCPTSEESIAERLSKGFRIVEHKQILNNYFPRIDEVGDSGVLEIF
jgi:hypothetical protein